METYVKQSKPSARTLSARAGHGQPDMATILQTYRNRTAQLAALKGDEEETLQGKFTTQLQEEEDEVAQGKFVAQLQEEDEEGTLQGKFVTQLQSDEEKEPLQQKAENRTGLPDRLKNGVESLSGYSLDAVKVHYNSPKPAQLQALAYTQGTDIHVGPGQERHLGHEAWHVVQQMQGRVQPTTQLQGVAVNDNEGLEREADVMGEKAVGAFEQAIQPKKIPSESTGMPLQLIWTVEGVNNYLGRDEAGRKSIDDLNNQNYTVRKVKDTKITRTYTDKKKPTEENYVIRGWHCRSAKEIAISDDSNDHKTASTTIVHEVAHANQHEANENTFFFLRWLNRVPYPDVLSKEVDAHKQHEAYNKRMGFALNPELWTGDTLDESKVTAYVKRVYLAENKEGKRPYKEVQSKTEYCGDPIKPWPKPGVV